MAKVWFVREVGKPTWKAPLESPPHFGESTPLDAYRSPRYIVVEVEDQDITGSPGKGWRSGFYLSRLLINEAREKLQGSN